MQELGLRLLPRQRQQLEVGVEFFVCGGTLPLFGQLSHAPLDPERVMTPGIFVQRIIAGAAYENQIEQRTTRKKEDA